MAKPVGLKITDKAHQLRSRREKLSARDLNRKLFNFSGPRPSSPRGSIRDKTPRAQRLHRRAKEKELALTSLLSSLSVQDDSAGE